MSRAKITYVQLANKRTVELKLHEDGALSIAQVQDGDFIRIPEAYVSDFVDALNSVVGQVQVVAAPITIATGSAITLTCSICLTSAPSDQFVWNSCNDCGTMACCRICQNGHRANSNCVNSGWSLFK